MTFVGYKQILTSGNETYFEELRTIIQDYYRQPSYYFLRWKHQVSGILDYLPPEFPSPEGQMFNADLELRWKQNSRGYQVLLLSRNQPHTESQFTPIKKDWLICDRNAYLYDVDETKFPQGFTYKNSHQKDIDPKKLSLGQRYFQEAQTSTVHFVALTIND
jgi:hypothetical protein